MSDCDYEHLKRARRRDTLAQSSFARWEALASYSLRTAQIASDMQKLLESGKAGGFTKEMTDTLDYMQTVMQQCFVDAFGKDPFDREQLRP